MAGRWRGVALLAGILAMGCSAAEMIQPPASFFDYVRIHGASFSAALPAAGELSGDEAMLTVKGERDRHPAFASSAPLQEIYGIIVCPDAVTCRDAFSTKVGNSVHVWVVWSPAPAGPGATHWLAVNAVTGFYAVGEP